MQPPQSLGSSAEEGSQEPDSAPVVAAASEDHSDPSDSLEAGYISPAVDVKVNCAVVEPIDTDKASRISGCFSCLAADEMASNSDTKSRRSSRRGSRALRSTEGFEESVFNSKERGAGYHRPEPQPEGFAGPFSTKRKSTDIICLLLIIAAWVIMTLIGQEAMREGNPYALINGIDDKGRICGVDESVKDLPKFYPVLLRGVGVCIEKCPEETAPQDDIHNTDLWICLSSVKEEDKQDEVDKCIIDDNIILAAPGCVCNFIWESADVINYCIITDVIIEEAFKMMDSSGYIGEIFGALLTAAPVIFSMGVGGALVASILYARLLTVPLVARIMVWGAIFSVLGFLASLAYVLHDKANEYAREEPQVKSDDEIKALRITADVFACIAGLYFCLMVFLRKRIGLGIAIVKQASRAIIAMPIIVLTPFVQFLGTAAFLAVWTIFAVYLAGTSTVTTEQLTDDDSSNSYKVVEYPKETQQRAWVMIFILFWTLNLIVAIGEIANAMAIASWYFTRDKKSVGNLSVFGAYAKTFRYHLGTAAFGSLIIAVLQTIRAVLMYLRRQAKLEENRVAQLIYKILMCVMWCVEKCLKFINKNAYIQTALTGKSFMPAAKSAFFLILRNILRIGALSLVSNFLLFVGKMFVTAVTVAATFYLMVDEYDNELNSVMAPLILVTILAWHTSEVFCEVFGMATDTIIQCFILDEEWNGMENSFALPELRKFIEKHGVPNTKFSTSQKAKGQFDLDDIPDDNL